MGTRPLSGDDTARLLAQTSRTFALAIPLLEEPLQTQVGLAYLLFRIADTLEDAPLWARDRRASALGSFARWIDGPQEDAHWRELVRESAPTNDPGCVELFDRAGDVLVAARANKAPVTKAIMDHTRRTALGMAEFVERQDERGAIVLTDIEDLRRYTYVVAGIVGELLTDLFTLEHEGLANVRVRAELDADAVLFGEALQLVNILKDQSADHREGRSYLPPNVPRSVVVDLARADIERALRYVRTLAEAHAPRGVVAFCELPVRLAQATLVALEAGASKISRDDVMRILTSVVSRS
jgi:farnesyl-diphosphate farnesyltransferase